VSRKDSGDQDDGHVEVVLADGQQKLDAAHPRHHDVADDHVRPLASHASMAACRSQRTLRIALSLEHERKARRMVVRRRQSADAQWPRSCPFPSPCRLGRHYGPAGTAGATSSVRCRQIAEKEAGQRLAVLQCSAAQRGPTRDDSRITSSGGGWPLDEEHRRENESGTRELERGQPLVETDVGEDGRDQWFQRRVMLARLASTRCSAKK